MKNSNEPIGNRICDPLACSAVPQPTLPPRTPQQLCSAHLTGLKVLYPSNAVTSLLRNA